ncbi:hypothetical protein AKO1_009018 [Acrasis kona]|uniref:Uncharacterized protein n=1 Tax=Acrasis kona TaxID=1008807 RepID=A0AAW2ZH21_9EUKA
MEHEGSSHQYFDVTHILRQIFAGSVKITRYIEGIILWLAFMLFVLWCTLHFAHVNGIIRDMDNNTCIGDLIQSHNLTKSHRIIKIYVEGIISSNLDVDSEYASTFNDSQVFAYSKEKGFLYLTSSMKEELDIKMLTIKIPWSHECFSETSIFHTYMMALLVGYDTFMLNQFVRYGNASGVMYSVSDQEMYNLGFAEKKYLEKEELTEWDSILWSKLSIVVQYVITVCLVHFLLKHTQTNALRLILSLQRFSIQGLQLPFLRSSIFCNLFNCLIFLPVMKGVVMYLGQQMFDDQRLSFLLCGLLWIFQIFMVMCSNTSTTKNYLPWFVHSYCILFLIYVRNYPFGYTYLSCAVLHLCILHLLLHFWNSCEHQHYLNHPFVAQRRQPEHVLVIRLRQPDVIL